MDMWMCVWMDKWMCGWIDECVDGSGWVDG